MEVGLAVLADAANVSREGKLNILGEFNTIFAGRFPVTWPKMNLVLKLEATVGEGSRHRLGIRVINQDGKLVAPPVDGEIELGPPLQTRPAPPGSSHHRHLGGRLRKPRNIRIRDFGRWSQPPLGAPVSLPSPGA